MSDITRSEAIKQLRLLKGDITFGIASKVENKNQIEALSIAIASLETDEAYDLEYEQPEFCKNCIDREAVYYYISSHIHEIITESGTDKNAHTNAILRSLANGVKTMPSVLPKVTKNDLGVDYISKQEVVGLMMHIWGKNHSGDDAMQECIDAIRDMSSVTPQPRVDFKELKRKILMEVDGGTDDAWLAYGEVCNRISNSIDEYVQNIKALPSVTPIRPRSEWEQDHEILKAHSDGANEILDKIRAEIEQMTPTYHNPDWSITDLVPISEVLKRIDKYKVESEPQKSEEI